MNIVEGTCGAVEQKSESSLLASSSGSPRNAPSSILHELDTSCDPDEDLHRLRFVMDFSMFRVAKQLRLLGYDVVCDARLPHHLLLPLAAQQKRLIVSGSRTLPPQVQRHNKDLLRQQLFRETSAAATTGGAAGKSSGGLRKLRVVIGYNSDGESEYENSSSDDDIDDEQPVELLQVNATDAHDKTLHTIMHAKSLVWDPTKIFTRCVTCNRLIKAIDRKIAEPRVHPTVFRVYRNFYQCPICEKVFWGVDNGVIVNFKALRTIEYLKRYAPPVSATTPLSSTSPASSSPVVLGRQFPTFRRHFLSYPRAVKCLIFDFLDAEGLDAAAAAFPMLAELVNIVRNGDSRRFVPEWKMKDRSDRRAFPQSNSTSHVVSATSQK
ncbi:Hypothetical protein, putative [Bodo saltans]|uniref:Mut7-C RNAse domain-containing protein n=1 Tax=Bodo saltans TaxID=75058 RepID=A0A0S4J6L8_BODSA|nr:Hypothetical protein, putative [Bodo saltans]|eukprot:CUG87085.1 Hypothetical protein, putative [Bodo saltans]